MIDKNCLEYNSYSQLSPRQNSNQFQLQKTDSMIANMCRSDTISEVLTPSDERVDSKTPLLRRTSPESNLDKHSYNPYEAGLDWITGIGGVKKLEDVTEILTMVCPDKEGGSTVAKTVGKIDGGFSLCKFN